MIYIYIYNKRSHQSHPLDDRLMARLDIPLFFEFYRFLRFTSVQILSVDCHGKHPVMILGNWGVYRSVGSGLAADLRVGGLGSGRQSKDGHSDLLHLN